MIQNTEQFKDAEIINIRNAPDGSRIQANLDILLFDKLLVKGVKVVEGPHGRFVSFPQREVKGQYYDVITITDKVWEKRCYDHILRSYGLWIVIPEIFEGEKAGK